MTSSSSGATSVIVLQFDLRLNIDVAEEEVQSAINASSSFLPANLPSPPIYSKTNPADAPVLTIRFNKEGTEGFSVGLQQLLEAGAIWLPEQHVYITLANNPVPFAAHLASLKGERILTRTAREADASLEQYNALWADFGDPRAWDVSWQTRYMGTRGHLTVTAPAHGAVYKFAIDRWANARPDFA